MTVVSRLCTLTVSRVAVTDIVRYPDNAPISPTSDDIAISSRYRDIVPTLRYWSANQCGTERHERLDTSASGTVTERLQQTSERVHLPCPSTGVAVLAGLVAS